MKAIVMAVIILKLKKDQNNNVLKQNTPTNKTWIISIVDQKTVYHLKLFICITDSVLPGKSDFQLSFSW